MKEKIDKEQIPGRLSLYLHSSRKQVELADTLKQSFKLGVVKANPLGDELYKALGDEDDQVFVPPIYVYT